MPDYRKLYNKLFNAVTSAEHLITQAAVILRAVQLECEELYIEDDSTSEQEARAEA